jgi:hypothetical protein
MRIQVQLPKIMLIHADLDADPKPLFALQRTIDLLKDFNSSVGIPMKLSEKWINHLNCVNVTSCVINY